MALKINYTNELLQSFCKENNVIIENNITENVNCNTKIISKCLINNCNNSYEKKFHILFNVFVKQITPPYYFFVNKYPLRLIEGFTTLCMCGKNYIYIGKSKACTICNQKRKITQLLGA